MRLLDPLWIALSTYSVLPAPAPEWNEKNLRFSICFLPAVGAFLGLALLALGALKRLIGMDNLLFAVFASVLPLLLTGGIHMDGFLDCADALASHQTREKKLMIMKDPHTGAFAVIYCGVYLLLSFGLYHTLVQGAALSVVSLSFILSRALAALSAFTLPNARKEGMLCAFTQHTHRRAAIFSMVLLALCVLVCMLFLSPAEGGLAAAFALLSLFAYRRMALKQFGGATGDTTGFFIQCCELAMLFGVWVGGLL